MYVNNVTGSAQVIRAYLDLGKVEDAIEVATCLERQAENLAVHLRLERAELLSYTGEDETTRMERWLALGDDERWPLYRRATAELTGQGIFRPTKEGV